LTGRAGKFGLSGSLAMKAKAKAKILELGFRRRITLVCFLYAAQGPGLGRWRISQKF